MRQLYKQMGRIEHNNNNILFNRTIEQERGIKEIKISTPEQNRLNETKDAVTEYLKGQGIDTSKLAIITNKRDDGQLVIDIHAKNGYSDLAMIDKTEGSLKEINANPHRQGTLPGSLQVRVNDWANVKMTTEQPGSNSRMYTENFPQGKYEIEQITHGRTETMIITKPNGSIWSIHFDFGDYPRPNCLVMPLKKVENPNGIDGDGYDYEADRSEEQRPRDFLINSGHSDWDILKELSKVAGNQYLENRANEHPNPNTFTINF